MPTRKTPWIAAAGLLLLAGCFGIVRLLALPVGDVSVPPEMGLRGPLIVEFGHPLPPQAADDLALQPQTAGRWQIEGSQALFWPQSSLAVGQQFRVEIRAGLTTGDHRRLLRNLSFEVVVRQPQLAYLGGVSQSAEVWLARADGSGAVPLTATGGQALDFAPAPDGSRLVAVVQNEAGGSDLYLVERDGSDQRRLLACGTVHCQQPAWHPDGRQLIYTRVSVNTTPKLHTLNLAGQDESTGYSGWLPSWSPDGGWLVYYQRETREIHLVNLSSGEDWRLKDAEEAPGAWSEDGKFFYYLGLDGTGDGPFTIIYAVDLENRLVRPALATGSLATEYSLPRPSPAGDELLVGYRPAGTLTSKQLAIYSLQGEQVQPVTDEQLFTHASYAWSPDGTLIAYQRFQAGSADDSLPEVVVWRRADGLRLLIARDAALPAWLP